MNISYIHRWSLLIILLCFESFISEIHSQIYLQLETRGSFNTRRLEVGDEMGYTLKSDPKNWYYGVIDQLYVDGQVIAFEHDVISLNNIARVRLKRKNSFFTSTLPAMLVYSGGSFAFFGTIAAVTGDKNAVVPAIIGGASVIVGLLMRRWVNRIFRLGDKRRLRIIDLNFYEVPVEKKT